MKNQIIVLVITFLSITGYAQVGINNTNPKASLDITASNPATPANTDGILIPRIDAFPVTNPGADQQGMMVYLTTTSGGNPPGFYYWDNTAGPAAWVQVLKGDDADWYEESTTTAPNNINDDIYTYGNVAIGKSTADYSLDIQSTGSRGIYNRLTGNTSGSVYGNYTDISNSGNGNHYGSYNDLGGPGTGTQVGSNQIITNLGNGAHVGSNNFMSGSGTGNHWGTYNTLLGSGTGYHYGSYNILSGAGSGNKYASYNLISTSAGGTHYGVYSDVRKPTGYAGYFIGRMSLGNAATNRYLMPAADGTANQVMATDGSGNVSFVNANTIVTGNTLDQAYDEGGAGAGRTITADNGAVNINGGDGFQVTGIINSGDAITLTGTGTRMFFNPKKGAFRAGDVRGNFGDFNNNVWNDVNVGKFSFAGGINTKASGEASTAFGKITTASGQSSTAMGTLTTASGFSSTAMGTLTTASGQSSTAIGQNTMASGDLSISGGINTTASGNVSVAIGRDLVAPSYAETAIGGYNTNYTPVSNTAWNANDRLFVIGNGVSNGSRSNALTIYKNGRMNINDEYNMPLIDGTANQVMVTNGAGQLLFTNPSSIFTDTNTQNTLDQAYDEGGAGAGRTITADNGAVNINGGDGIQVTGLINVGASISLTGTGTRMFFNPKKGAFRAGDVRGNFGDFNNNVWNDVNVGKFSFAGGSNTKASGEASTAFGRITTASGAYSTAMGKNSTASGVGSTAMGNQTTASGNYSTAMGYYTTALSYGETTIGVFNTNYTPVSNTDWNANDRLFVVGDGENTGNRSNALTIYKNGLMNINDAYNMPLADGTANQIMATDGAGQISFVDPTTVGTDDQNITGSSLVGTNLTIGIENGTSQTINLAPLQDGTGTDDQTIDTFSFNTGTNVLTLEVENDGIAAQTVDLSSLQDGTGTDDQTIDTFSFNAGTNVLTLEVENDGIAAQTVDLSSLQDGTGTDDQNITGSSLVGTNLTIGIENGTSQTINLAPLQDGNTQNTLDQAYDEGGAGSGRTIIADNGAVTINGTDGFVVTGTQGSGAVAPSGAGTKMFFNPRKAAFRAGNISSTHWNDANIGTYSFAAGSNTIASAVRSFAMGYLTTASGDSAASFGQNTVASGISSFAMGDRSTASGGNTLAMGYDTKAQGINSAAFGNTTIASGSMSLATGQSSTASGIHSVAMGTGTTASGDQSLATGSGTTASGEISISGGLNTTASGDFSVAIGNNLTAPSYIETVFGAFSTNYTPSSTTTWDASDRLFVIGNGVPGTRNNALTIYKNGLMNINNAYNMPLTDGTPNQVMATDGSGTVSFVNANTIVTSNTLDQAYDQGGAGAGRIINTTDGAVRLNGTDGLEVRGASAGIEISNTAENESGIHFRDSGNTSQYADINYDNSNTNNSLNMYVNSATPMLTLDDSQRVGIGTTTPDTKLAVAGIISAASDATEVNKVELGHGGANGYINNVGAGNLDFRHEGSNYMTLTDTGRLGIGTTTPSASLEVKRNSTGTLAHLELEENQANDGARIKFTNTSETNNNWVLYGRADNTNTNSRFNIYNSVTGNILVATGDGKVGILRTPTTNAFEVNGQASKSTAGSWAANSDRRLKKEILSISGKEALNKINKMRGVTYLWNDNKTGIKRPTDIQYGFIAQELMEVFPNKVSKDNLGYYQTAYGDYDPVFVEAIKELNKRLETLSEKNQQQEEKIDVLTAENQLLKQKLSIIKSLEERLKKLEKQ